MRNLIVLWAAVALSGWLTTGTIAKAEMGCLCTALGKATCVSGIAACMSGAGVCLLPCDYTPAKKASTKKMLSKKKS